MITEAEYKALVDADNQFMAWLRSTGKNYSGGSNPVPEGIKSLTNNERGEIQEYVWYNLPTDKDAWYIEKVDLNTRKAIIQTFNGVKLADVTLCRTYRSNFGDKRISIRVKGFNGCTYYGTFYIGAGDYADLKAWEGQGNDIKTRERTYYGKKE